MVKHLKKRYKEYKNDIKNSIDDKNKWFPIVVVKRNDCLDKCAKVYARRGYCEELDNSVKTAVNADNQTNQTKKKKSITDTINVNVLKINDENDVLDFDEDFEEANNGSVKTSGKSDDKSANKSSFNQSSKSKSKSNNTAIVSAIDLNTNINFNFKIPKRPNNGNNPINTESIVGYAKTMINSSNITRIINAYDYLTRNLSEDQWENKDVIAILCKIAVLLAMKCEMSTHVTKMREIVDKLKSMKHTDSEFWDELISTVEKRRAMSQCKCTHQIYVFLASLHTYILKHSINMRLLTCEAMFAAYKMISKENVPFI